MTPGFILERMKRRIGMKRDPAGAFTQNATLLFLWFCQTGRGRERARVCFPSVWHSAFQVIGWFDVFCLLRQLTSGMRAPELCLCLLLFIHLFIWIPYPSLIQLIRSYFFCVSPHFNAQIVPDYSFHSIFASFVSPSCFCFILALSAPLSLYRMYKCASHSLTCEWSMVNMLPAALSGRAGGDVATLWQLPSITLLPLPLCEACVHFGCAYLCVFTGGQRSAEWAAFASFFFCLHAFCCFFKSSQQPGSENWGASPDHFKWYSHRHLVAVLTSLFLLQFLCAWYIWIPPNNVFY